MIRLFVRLITAAERRSFVAPYVFVMAAWVTALRMLGERYTVMAGEAIGRSPFSWLVHILAFYTALHLTVTATLSRAAGTPWKSTANVAGLGLLLGVVPPWIDVWIYGPGAFGYNYVTTLELPWLLYAPPRSLPIGETTVLWSSVLMVAGFAWLRAVSPARRLATPLAYYLLIFTLLSLLPLVARRASEADSAVPFTDWLVITFTAAAMVATWTAARVLRQAARRALHAAVPALLALAGAALVRPLDGAAWLAAALFALLGAGFAVSNDYYDRAADEAAGRRSAVDHDVALLSFALPLLAIAGCFPFRLELGLAAIAFVAVAYTYQADPLRTKCVFPLSYKTEALLAGAALLGGMTSSPGTRLEAWHGAAVVITALGAAGALVFKDYKDVDADAAAGVRTAFVVGRQAGWPQRRILGISVALLALTSSAPTVFVALRGAAPVATAVTAVLALGAPVCLVSIQPPRRAVYATLAMVVAFLAAAVWALASHWSGLAPG